MRRSLLVPIVVSLALVLSLGMGATLFFNHATNALIESNHWVVHTYQVLRQIEAVSEDIRSAESAQRGFLLSKNPEFRQALQDSTRELETDTTTLRELLADSPGQTQRAVQLSKLFGQRLEVLDRRLALVDTPEEETRGLAVLEEGRQVMKAIESLTQKMEAEEIALARQRSDRMEEDARSTQQLSALQQALQLILVVGVCWGLLRFVRTEKEIRESLARARDSAVETAQVKASFLATMSHEIRTPMNGIIGMTGLLLSSRLSTAQREYAETIRDSGEVLLTLINDILDFSKLEAGKLRFEKIGFSLRETLESTMDLIAAVAARKGLEVGLLIESDVPAMLTGDPGRLRQIVLNLLSNAVKFTDTGEILIHVSAQPAGAEEVLLRVEVTDTGIGIAPEQQRLLFQPFQQIDATTTRRYGGTGLGLAISRQLVGLMDGETNVRSVPGQGSTFWFTARLSLSSAEDSERLSSGISPLPRRVLIVDDNATNRKIVRYQLESWKIDSQELENPVLALSTLRHAAELGTPFDAVILDMQMPGMDGLTLTQLIRAEYHGGPLPLILLTSLQLDLLDEERVRALVDQALTKPVKQSQLYNALVAVASSKAHSPRPSPEAAPEPLPEPPEETVAASGALLQILIAEDNSVNQRVLVHQLGKLGFHPGLAANGREALDQIRQRPYDLILMDCEMPEMDGYEASRAIRADAALLKQPIIIAVTAHALEGAREKCVAAGMDDYLSKPIRLQELSEKLRQWTCGAIA